MARSLTGVLLYGMKRGGGVTGVGCGVELEATHPWRGEAGVALDGGARSVTAAAPCFSVGGGRKDGWARWAERPDGPAGRWGRRLKENSFLNKNWIFEYTRALEICRRRFRRNFNI
jgi:hypothetical protein